MFELPNNAARIVTRPRVDPSRRAHEGTIAPIQYLRGIAAMSVVLFHAIGGTEGLQAGSIVSGFVPSGVDLFFVISGFIMWVTTADKPVTAGAFAMRRIVRIVPLYWFVTLLIVACKVIPGALPRVRVSGPATLKSLLFIPYDSLSSPGHIYPIVEPGWTLNYEMFFYALFTVSLVLAVRTRFIALLASMGALSLVGALFGPFTNPIATTYTGPLLLEFAAGVIIGILWMRGVLRPGLALAVGAVVCGFYLLAARSGSLHPVGAVLVVLGSLGPVFGHLKSRLLMVLGNASYSIYLTHALTLGALAALWRHVLGHSSQARDLSFIVVALIACAIVGGLCYALVEHPITTRLRRLTPGAKAGPGAVRMTQP